MLSFSPGDPSGGGADGVRRTRGSSLRFLRLIRSSDVVDLGSWVSTSVLDPARLIQPTFCLTMMSVLKLSSVCLRHCRDRFWSICLRHCRDGYSFPVIKPNMVSSSKCSPITFFFYVHHPIKLNCFDFHRRWRHLKDASWIWADETDA